MDQIGRPSAESVARRTRDLKVASFSDVHLGHPTTSSRLILENLYKAFPDNAKTGELDLILLGGDLFDGSLNYSDVDIGEIERWMYYMLNLCHRRKIVLRCLEGTFSHDRGQGVNFTKVAAMCGFEVDFRYVKNIEVETIQTLGITMLYVPDFTTAEVDRIWKEVQQALARTGVEAVDYCNLHGAFSYQLPPIAKVQSACHSMERFLSIVRNYIWTGHIHLSSVYDRILCNGSFDRLNHGEEAPKGHWEALIRQNGDDDFVFVVNEGAKLYKSLDCTHLSLEDALALIDATVATLRSDSAIRIVAERGDPILHALARVRKEHPQFQWTTKSVEVKDIQKHLLVDLRGEFAEVEITPITVVPLLLERLQRRHPTDAVYRRATEILTELVNS